ncbi:MAG: hypothetical protein EG825_00355 [Rhodocyclaceae bacterium]|nr:hypothetical protein [Rhodocyclaceae bacterium]
MTTIAWDGETLAADKGSWSGGLHHPVRKVFKITDPSGDPFLVAFCGCGGFATAVLGWMKGGDHPGPCHPDDVSRVCALAVDVRRDVWELSGALRWMKREGSLATAGAGQEIAIGALMAGASAVEAVNIAASVSYYAARGVDSVCFE